MDYTFPVFILAMDDKSIRVSRTKDDLLYYEQSDIEEGIYMGWDKNGCPIQLIWEPAEGPNIKVVVAEPQKNKLQEALYNYARLYRPKEPFTYSGPADDPLALYEAVKTHIKGGTLKDKIRKLFKKK